MLDSLLLILSFRYMNYSIEIIKILMFLLLLFSSTQTLFLRLLKISEDSALVMLNQQSQDK